jgi:hypothetical protein
VPFPYSPQAAVTAHGGTAAFAPGGRPPAISRAPGAASMEKTGEGAPLVLFLLFPSRRYIAFAAILSVVLTAWGRERNMEITEKILKEVFHRLLNTEPKQETLKKLQIVIDGMMEKFQDTFELDTVQRQNTFRAIICSMFVHGWGMGMHPYNNNDKNLDERNIEVRVSKDILIPMENIKAIRYVKKDDQGRVKKVLFEPDQNERIRGQIDNLLEKISKEKWGEK